MANMSKTTTNLTLNLPQDLVFDELTDIEQDLALWKKQMINTFELPSFIVSKSSDFDDDVALLEIISLVSYFMF